ncbi:hypothetical protein Sjap_006512 [Stephania japonica]|uniref:NAB domain-containing protein n=1 Tax=Stephania japonica TaxID=461633 RepID=A0AAP0K7L0_9MAGN
MATLTHAESRRMYSWWWDSHISPKNSKWLQENLTDMDAKVKAMIKLIELDADSFARRAEMYYKQRPELMKLVEEFYRAYRALAERYDHATGALRQAHRTMAEAFPNQVPLVLTDDSPSGPFPMESEPHTPEMPHPMRAFADPDDLGPSSQFHSLNRNGLHTDESDFSASRKGLKQLNEFGGSGEGRVRKGLNFHEDEGQGFDKPEAVHVCKSDAEVQNLKEALAKLEAEKESSLIQYQQSLERLSNLETEVSNAQEDARGLNEHMRKAENEVRTLKQSLVKLETEKDAAIQQYQQCLERVSNLESKISVAEKDAGGLNERACKAEDEVQTLKQALARLEAEKDAILLRHKQCLEIITNMERKIAQAEEEARGHKDRADRAEAEIQSLKQIIAKLNEEKEASAIQYQHCLESISHLETKVSSTEEEIKRLNNEIASGVATLNSTEQQYLLLDRDNHALQKEVETLILKIEMQKQELFDKQSELEKIRSLLHEESLRSVKAEATLLALQTLHTESQEQQRVLAVDLQKSVLMLKDMEHWGWGLEEEVRRIKEENKNLNEQNLSSAMSMTSMQDEIMKLKERIVKLEEEVELRVDQRNALQQEIYCLKEEINDLNRQHQGVIKQVDSVGLNLESLGSSVKELQEENVKLKEIHQKENDEKLALLHKLENMEKLLEKNALLENSLSDVNAELEGLRERVKELEDSFQVMQGEKSTLFAEKATIISQLEVAAANMEKLSEKNSFLENSLSDTNVELEVLKAKSKSLEQSCESLDKERAALIDERETLVSHLKTFQLKLEELDKKYIALADKYLDLEKEKESTIHRVEELQVSLDLEKQEHGSFVQLTEIRLTSLEEQILLLQEESRWRKREYEEEQDKSIKAQVEISILQMCIYDLEEKNILLTRECQKYFDELKLSGEMISELKEESLVQQKETNFLLKQIESLRTGIQQVSKSIKIESDSGCQSKVEQDQMLIQHILQNIKDAETALLLMQDEKQEILLEKSILVTLLGQLRLEAADLESETKTLDSKSKAQSEELLILKSGQQRLQEIKEQLQLEVQAGQEREGVLNEAIEALNTKLSVLQEAYLSVKSESKKLQEENGSLTGELSDLKREKCMLEEENNILLHEVIALDNLFMVFKSLKAEKALEVQQLTKDLDGLHGVNSLLEVEITATSGKLQVVETENLQLKESVEKLESELETSRNVTQQLHSELERKKDMLNQREMELSEVGQILIDKETETMELCININSLRRDYEESTLKSEELEKHMLELSEVNNQRDMEICCLNDINEKFKEEMTNLHEEVGQCKLREESLRSELVEARNVIELQEAEAASLYGKLQHSIILGSLFEGKANELLSACQRLENESALKCEEAEHMKERILALDSENEEFKEEMINLHEEVRQRKLREENLSSELVEARNVIELQEAEAASLYGELQHSVILGSLFERKANELFSACQRLGNESALKCEEAEHMKERILALESENGGLKSELAAFFIMMNSLNDSLISLEDHVASRTKLLMDYNQETKDAPLQSQLHEQNSKEVIADQGQTVVANDTSSVHGLESAVKAVEDAMIEMERVALQESFVNNIKLAAAMKKLEELKSKNSFYGNEKLKVVPANLKPKAETEISKVRNGTVVKDIPLDQASECLPFDHRIGQQGKTRREKGQTDDQMLELWEATEQDCIVYHQLNNGDNAANAPTAEDPYHHLESVEGQRSGYPSSELQTEKELAVDKLEVSRRFKGLSRQGTKKKTLERLASDGQMLVNIQITIEDLKKKIAMSTKGKHAKGMTEYDDLKNQLEKIEESVTQLVDLNAKLAKSAEGSPSPSRGKATGEESDDSSKIRRRKVIEQARRGSEKIGRLQLELQQIQFVLLKLEDANEVKARSTTRRSTKILLRDYIYGGGRNGQKKKKTPCCACMRPAIRGDSSSGD